MAGTPPVIDIEALAAPFEGENPCGPNLRQDESDNAPYYALRRLQGQARAAERQAAMAAVAAQDGESDAGDDAAVKREWQSLLDMCEKTLRETTKDIEVVSWMIEALVRVSPDDKGYAGLRDGFTLAAELIERYWDNLNYDTEDGDAGAKGQPFAGLNGTDREGALIRPLKNVPITPVGDNGAFGLGKCEQLQRDKQIAEAENLARQGGAAFYQPLMADLTAAAAAYQRVTTLLDDKLGRDAPGSSQIREAFEAADRMVRLLGGHYLTDEESAAAGASAGGGDSTAGATDGGGVAAMIARPGSFASREQALEMLNAVAKFFREREPHSPISYALDSMIERARMPLFDLLADLLPDEDVRTRVLQNAGIRPPKPPEVQE
ncbi:type VI secretion system protein TssA [Reyranella sp. CPCC 100927]|uniref:type VI secretion system protein TssA n=1 Tax=Reyranella sp. CPCC 100927 TaxID=2599616 RepID=UPI0011B78560|nr:type VI secretion system protein TssA [Reyranella sp. CPCC 100927]TWT08713.1 type VI secretion system protein TssA [Reyranella sp. CPCC 100927]